MQNWSTFIIFTYVFGVLWLFPCLGDKHWLIIVALRSTENCYRNNQGLRQSVQHFYTDATWTQTSDSRHFWRMRKIPKCISFDYDDCKQSPYSIEPYQSHLNLYRLRRLQFASLHLCRANSSRLAIQYNFDVIGHSPFGWEMVVRHSFCYSR